jgi:hypothetical protein
MSFNQGETKMGLSGSLWLGLALEAVCQLLKIE